MKKITPSIFLFLTLCQASIASANDSIQINLQQMQTLGIKVAPLTTASPVMSNQLPGVIVVPVGQERIVSAPKAG